MKKPIDVAVKLDLSKTYDRVNWSFLIKILEKMGFDNQVVDMIWKLMANYRHSILING